MATMKQRAAAKKLVENSGKPMRKILKEVGYSDTTADQPDKVTKSKAWPELLEEFLPDTLLGSKHNELLNVPKKVRKLVKGDVEYEYEELDSQAVSKGLDMAYKLKKKYPAEERTVRVSFEAMTDEQLLQIVEEGKQ